MHAGAGREAVSVGRNGLGRWGVVSNDWTPGDFVPGGVAPGQYGRLACTWSFVYGAILLGRVPPFSMFFEGLGDEWGLPAGWTICMGATPGTPRGQMGWRGGAVDRIAAQSLEVHANLRPGFRRVTLERCWTSTTTSPWIRQPGQPARARASIRVSSLLVYLRASFYACGVRHRVDTGQVTVIRVARVAYSATVANGAMSPDVIGDIKISRCGRSGSARCADLYAEHFLRYGWMGSQRPWDYILFADRGETLLFFEARPTSAGFRNGVSVNGLRFGRIESGPVSVWAPRGPIGVSHRG